MTSPPYWGLRDYGSAVWEGGHPDCDHKVKTRHQAQGATSQRKGRANVDAQRSETFRRQCGICGAVRVDPEIGLELTFQEYLAALVRVFQECHRVLNPRGTMWVNMGDSYSTDSKWGGKTGGLHAKGLHDTSAVGRQKISVGLPDKNLVGQPWRLAFALQDAGWILRNDIIWHKPSPMPGSQKDRCTVAHEYIFLLAKQRRYHFDWEAIAEPVKRSTLVRLGQDVAGQKGSDRGCGRDGRPMKAVKFEGDKGGSFGAEARQKSGNEWVNPSDKAMPRDVWTFASATTTIDHFAVFPEELPRRCIRAGCIAGGVVLDPFVGTGTAMAVALAEGRRAVGIELNPGFAEMARTRLETTTPSLFLGGV